MVGFFHEHDGLSSCPARRSSDVYGDRPAPGPGTARSGPPRRRATLGPEVLREPAPPALRDLLPGHGRHGRAGPRGNSSRPPGATPAACSTPRGGWGCHALDLVTRRRDMQLVNGTALTGRLMRAALDLGVHIRVSTPVTELLRTMTGASPACHRRRRGYRGARRGGRRPGKRRRRRAGDGAGDGGLAGGVGGGGGVSGTGGSTGGGTGGAARIMATRGVVLAAGGFPHDVARRKCRAVPPHADRRSSTGRWPRRRPTATGTTLGESAGGGCDTNVASPGRVVPGVARAVPGGRTGVFPHIMDRAKPGSIGVPPPGAGS